MALTEKLTNIGNAIRSKTGGTDLLTLDEMPTAIEGISGGGEGLTAEDLAFRGTLRQYTLSDKLGTSIVEKYKNLITFTDVNSANALFAYNAADLDGLIINIKNLNPDGFMQLFKGTKLPKVVGNIVGAYRYNSSSFSGWSNIREIPKSLYEGIIWGDTAEIGAYSNFSFNSSLREFPEELINSWPFVRNTGYEMYAGYNVFSSCYVLDSAVNYPVNSTIATSNMFNYFFNSCYRLSDLTFKLDESNQPIVVNWKQQTINSSTWGHTPSTNVILNYNSGITADKEVKDDTTYAALKDDPDWFTTNVAYSRYNHDSAVRTINSLPDTSAYLATAGGTNTIRFKGAAGSATDGGAINTLTEEEIAVATAKGWTVTLV